MDIHNSTEDVVVEAVQSIFDEIQKSGNPEGYCLCYQCRVDTICFTLNRVEPHYIVSNRGLSRIDNNSIVHQQTEADLHFLIYKGLKCVNHNMRPTAPHDGTKVHAAKFHNPLFDIPTIAGRIFNGISFEPVSEIEVELYCEGELAPMRNNNWQNPFKISTSTPGVFSFWPTPIDADMNDLNKVFNYSIRVKSPDYEPMIHIFSISTTSKFHAPHSYALNKTYKLPDLYLFPPDEEGESD